MTATRPQPRKAARPRWIRGPLTATKGADFLIVAIGVSAGGLEACKKLLDALPADNGMAFLIVQHLEPSHESLLVDLLSARTSMQVVQATDGMEIERERVHIIPPGVYLSVDGKGILRLSRPPERHAARLPVRLPAEFAGRRLRRARRLRGHVGHRRRRQLGIEGGEGEGRPRPRPRGRRGRL